MIRIGVNALYLIPGGVGGTEIYLRSLLAALACVDTENQYILFTNRETGDDLTPDRSNFRAAPLPIRAVNRPLRIAAEQLQLPAVVRHARVDVLLNAGFTAPVRAGCPQVTVFHDLQHKRHPEHFRWFDLPFWRLLLWVSARRSQALIAVSETTAKDLAQFYRVGEARIRTIAHGVDPEFFEIGRRREGRAPEPTILCVSTLHPHKNIERLVRAFAEFRKAKAEYRLVLAGMRGFHAAPVERTVASLGLSDSVRITGWIPRQDLYDLYERAALFVYPSTFEGFGMPVLEALAAGIPTVCSSIEPLVTIAGGRTLLFPPDSDSALAEAMLRLASDETLRQRLAEEGPARAAEFTWERCARETLGLLSDVARAG